MHTVDAPYILTLTLTVNPISSFVAEIFVNATSNVTITATDSDTTLNTSNTLNDVSFSEVLLCSG